MSRGTPPAARQCRVGARALRSARAGLERRRVRPHARGLSGGGGRSWHSSVEWSGVRDVCTTANGAWPTVQRRPCAVRASTVLGKMSHQVLELQMVGWQQRVAGVVDTGW